MKLVSRSGNGRRVNSTPQRQTTSNNNKTQRQSNATSRHAANSHARNGNYAYSDYDYSDVEQSHNVKQPAKKKNGFKAATITILVIALLFASAFVALDFHINSLDTNFPNTWADGIVDVSNLTIEETTQLLIAAGYERNAEGIAATVMFPDGSAFTVTGDEVGLSLNAAEAAQTLFEFGRNESFFNRVVIYVSSFIGRNELTDLSTPVLDESIIRQRADSYTIQFNATLLDDTVEINEDSITIIKGSGMEYADSDEVFNLAFHTLMRAVDEHNDVTAIYTPEASENDSIDLHILHETIHIDVVSSRFDTETRSVIESVQGRSFDLFAAEQMLANAINGQTITIPIYTTDPEYTTEEIQALLFRDVLGESTTRMANNANRVRNIQLTAEYINDTILYPGDVFSFNEIVGQRTAARGFQEAGVIRGGRLVQGIGGGICQTSSTIYDALLRTTLEVVYRRNHGLTISYLPPGRDATVYWEQIDFKFKNNTDFPVRVETVMDGLAITARLVGTRLEDYRIEIETVTISQTPFTVEHRISDELAPGETSVFTPGQNGITVDVFQRKYDGNGELISRTLISRDEYRMQLRVIYTGRQPEPPPEPYPPEPPPEPYPPETEP